jgi:hypothetical protein
MSNYLEQFERVKRYYARFQKLNAGRPHDVPSEEYFDEIYAFFQNCYHLKEYLKNDPAFTKHSNQDIEDFLNNTPALAICADICNGLKHLTLKRPPRSGDIPKISRKNIALSINETIGSNKPAEVKIKASIEIDHKGTKLDAFQVATDALRAWSSFIN